jgi:hypothetical protein
MPLRRFLALVESRPEFRYPSRLLAAAIGSEQARDALCASGVLVPDGLASWYPCAHGRRSCTRSVAVSEGRAEVRCGRLPEECAPESFQQGELGQHTFNELGLIATLQPLFGVEGQPVFRERQGQVFWLGRSAAEGGALVWLWLRPREPGFSLWMRELEDRGGRARVLVPTAAGIYTQTFDRYGPGQPVSIVHLDRALSVDGKRIVRVSEASEERARLPWPIAQPVQRTPARVHTPAGTQWRQIAIEFVNDDVVAIRVGDADPVRLTAAELGLTRATNGETNEQWRLLVALCAGSGTCERRSVGAASVDVLITRATRLGARLCDVLGIEGNPLHVSSRDETVTSDFRALPDTRRELARRSR